MPPVQTWASLADRPPLVLSDQRCACGGRWKVLRRCGAGEDLYRVRCRGCHTPRTLRFSYDRGLHDPKEDAPEGAEEGNMAAAQTKTSGSKKGRKPKDAPEAEAAIEEDDPFGLPEDEDAAPPAAAAGPDDEDDAIPDLPPPDVRTEDDIYTAHAKVLASLLESRRERDDAQRAHDWWTGVFQDPRMGPLYKTFLSEKALLEELVEVDKTADLVRIQADIRARRRLAEQLRDGALKDFVAACEEAVAKHEKALAKLKATYPLLLQGK